MHKSLRKRSALRLLTKEPRPYCWSIDESALRRIGVAKVMRDQLGRMIELVALPNVAVQVVRFSLGAHPSLKNPFTLLEFRPDQSPVVFVESTAVNLFLERIADLYGHGTLLQSLRTVALDPDSSVQLIEEVERIFDP